MLQQCVIMYRRYKRYSWQTNIIVMMGTSHGVTSENNKSTIHHQILELSSVKKTVLTHISATGCYSLACFRNGNLLTNCAALA